MKTNMIRNVSLALLAAASMFAQVFPKIEVNVPFGFHVGDTMLPAGQYSVDTQMRPDIIRVRSADTSQSVAILTNGGGRMTRDTKPKLVFNRYGDQYFLSQVWAPDTYAARELPKTKRELQEARNTRPSHESIIAGK